MKLHSPFKRSLAACCIPWLCILLAVAGQSALASTTGTQAALSETATSMNVTLGKSTLLRLPQAIARISVGNPGVADVTLINPSEVYILGKMIGTTNIILWTRNGPTRVVDVAVLMDTGALQMKLAEIMPEERDIQVSAAGDSLVLSGIVSDTVKADRAVALADTYIRTAILGMMVNMQSGGQGEGEQSSGRGGQQGMQALRQGMQSDEDSAGAGAGLGSIRVVNLLRVRDNQQVMLEVKVAEVNRTIAEKLGFDFARAMRKTGSAWTQVMAGVIGGGPANLLFGKNLSADVDLGLNRINNASMDKGTAFLIDAEKKDELIKVLAEPNIVAISGQEASFLVGEIMIPVFSSQQTTLESKQFGIGLRFTPTVLEAGRIHLRVTPEVSELLTINPVATTGLGQVVAVPTFKTRRISTTVQLADGQSLAIGGLLQDDFQEQVKRFPMLGEVPVLGALFRSSEYQKKKTELMVIVTPRLVKPLQTEYPLPTDAFVEPGRGEFLIQGRMENVSGQSPKQAGSTDAVGGFQMK